ncbi:hypothetical protein CJU78_13320 [Pseudomonas fragi]|nr:hypothetical protein CJU78_13320 [Pseudomonas fragi]
MFSRNRQVVPDNSKNSTQFVICNGFCGSGLARDSGDVVCQANRGETIASKPAPTKEGVAYTHSTPLIREPPP